jgi:hypothetical protein
MFACTSPEINLELVRLRRGRMHTGNTRQSFYISMIDRSPYYWPARAGILRACGCCSRTRLLTSWKWLIKWRRGSYVDQISRRVLFDKLRHRFDRDRLYEMVYPNTNAESHDTFLLVNALTMYGLMYPNDFVDPKPWSRNSALLSVVWLMALRKLRRLSYVAIIKRLALGSTASDYPRTLRHRLDLAITSKISQTSPSRVKGL